MFYKIENSFKIESIGYLQDRQFSPDFDFKGESHGFVELVYICSGCVEIVKNEKVYMLKSGDMAVHAPMEFHRIKSDGQTSPHVLNFSFKVTGNLPKQIFEDVFHLTLNQQADFLKYFGVANTYIKTFHSSPYTAQQAIDGLSSLLIEICQNKPLNNALSTKDSALLYKKLVNDMQKTIYENISLTELAKLNFVSVSYIKKLFAMYVNTGPKHFYDSLRAKEAAQLLQNGMSASAISEKMNFSSPNHFTVFFKRHFGVTPSEFKKENSSQTGVAVRD